MLTYQLARVQLPVPVIIYLAPEGGARPRVAAGVEPVPYDATNGEATEISYLDVALVLNVVTRTVHAQIAPIPRPLQIYGPDDFALIAADTPEQHAERVLEVLGNDPAGILQALINGSALPAAPIRVPREIANWRARAVLELQGLLPQVEEAIAAMSGPESIVVRNAWHAGAPLARHGATVTALASQLGLATEEIDAMFIAAESINV